MEYPPENANIVNWSSALPQPRKPWDQGPLVELCKQSSPAKVLYELTTHVNRQFALPDPMLKAIQWGSVCAANLQPMIDVARESLGWQQRFIDLQIVRELRRETKLCLVTGAGVTMSAGGPSWPGLVSGLIEIALGKEHEIARILPDPDGTLGDQRYVKEMIPVPALGAKEKDDLEQIRKHIAENDANSDSELLMRAADVCHRLFGQQLLKHISDAVYSRAPKPGAIHRAIAEVAREPRRSARFGIWPAWGSIINYNFDGLLFDALNDAGVPQVISWTQADQKPAWYRFPDQECEWWQPVFHLHGFTPSWRMNISDIDFVFSKTQYAEAYTKPATSLVEFIQKNVVSRPPITCLYIGCSFADQAMNQVLLDSWWEDFGRMHYALLPWPEPRVDRLPGSEEIEKHSMRYKVMGVQPIWFDEFDEIPGLILGLK